MFTAAVGGMSIQEADNAEEILPPRRAGYQKQRYYIAEIREFHSSCHRDSSCLHMHGCVLTTQGSQLLHSLVSKVACSAVAWSDCAGGSRAISSSI